MPWMIREKNKGEKYGEKFSDMAKENAVTLSSPLLYFITNDKFQMQDCYYLSLKTRKIVFPFISLV